MEKMSKQVRRCSTDPSPIELPELILSGQDQVSKAWDIARLALCAEFTRKPLTRNEINKEGEYCALQLCVCLLN